MGRGPRRAKWQRPTWQSGGRMSRVSRAAVSTSLRTLRTTMPKPSFGSRDHSASGVEICRDSHRIPFAMPLSIAALKAAGVDTSTLKLDIIKEVKAREILDSRGNPTIEVRRPSPRSRELNGPLRRLQVQFRVQQG